MLKSVLAFVIQILLIILVIKGSYVGVYKGDIDTDAIQINGTRVICAVILHVTIMSEVRCALDIMNYAKNNPEKFYGNSNVPAFFIGLMKLTGGVCTEITNLIVIVGSATVEDVVKDYIAFGIISEIDNLMLYTVDSKS